MARQQPFPFARSAFYVPLRSLLSATGTQQLRGAFLIHRTQFPMNKIACGLQTILYPPYSGCYVSSIISKNSLKASFASSIIPWS